MEKKNWIESDVLHHFKTTSHSSPNAILHQQLVSMNRLINSRPFLMHSISRSFVTIVEMKGHCSFFMVKSSANYETKRGTESKLGQIIKKSDCEMKMWHKGESLFWYQMKKAAATETSKNDSSLFNCQGYGLLSHCWLFSNISSSLVVGLNVVAVVKADLVLIWQKTMSSKNYFSACDVIGKSIETDWTSDQHVSMSQCCISFMLPVILKQLKSMYKPSRLQGPPESSGTQSR